MTRKRTKQTKSTFRSSYEGAKLVVEPAKGIRRTPSLQGEGEYVIDGSRTARPGRHEPNRRPLDHQSAQVQALSGALGERLQRGRAPAPAKVQIALHPGQPDLPDYGIEARQPLEAQLRRPDPYPRKPLRVGQPHPLQPGAPAEVQVRPIDLDAAGPDVRHGCEQLFAQQPGPRAVAQPQYRDDRRRRNHTDEASPSPPGTAFRW